MFVDNLGVFDKVMVSPAVRYEHYSDFGHTVNGNSPQNWISPEHLQSEAP